MPKIEVNNLKKEYSLGIGGRIEVFSDLSFGFEENETFISILAPFKSGKTTLLKIIAGLEEPSGGTVLLDGKKHPENRRKIVYIPEKPSSFPWLSVRENLKIMEKGPLNNDKFDKIMKLIGLEDYENHYPDDKSIGFRFRIAIGRAIYLNPAFILIDDSLKSLDQLTKKEIHQMLTGIASSMGIKFLIATTDVSEAFSLSDRIIVLEKSRGVAVEFSVKDKRNKDELIKLISQIENIFQNDSSSNKVNFVI